MVDPKETKNIGLRGVTVADTKISKVDGEGGNLYYRGYSVLDLAEKSTFEETAFLLLYGTLPDSEQLNKFKDELALERDVPDLVVHTLQERPKTSSLMNILQAVVCLLADHDWRIEDESKDANYSKAIQIIAKIPTIVAYWDRIKNSLPIIEPRRDLSLASNFLYMLKGEEANEQVARDMDVCLILHADQTFNASTFSAREIASTRAHIFAAVSGAIGALSGELHGGANRKVMEMLLKLKHEEDLDGWVRRELEKGGKIFGMGHAVYKTWDPRAKVLMPMSKRIGEINGDTSYYDLAVRLMEATQRQFKEFKGVDIFPNVDYFSAPAYYMMGIGVHMNTALFTMSRAAGWCAHVIEEKFAEAQPKPALYRPKAEYIGNYCGPEGCKFVPIDQRGKE